MKELMIDAQQAANLAALWKDLQDARDKERERNPPPRLDNRLRPFWRPCPSCGYCPSCGRSGLPRYPEYY